MEPTNGTKIKRRKAVRILKQLGIKTESNKGRSPHESIYFNGKTLPFPNNNKSGDLIAWGDLLEKIIQLGIDENEAISAFFKRKELMHYIMRIK